MKFFVVLTSLFAAAQAQFSSLSAPAFDATIQAGQNVFVQIIGPVVSYIELRYKMGLVFTNPSRLCCK